MEIDTTTGVTTMGVLSSPVITVSGYVAPTFKYRVKAFGSHTFLGGFNTLARARDHADLNAGYILNAAGGRVR